jgi:deoxyribodipyrimidine photo-lyase
MTSFPEQRTLFPYPPHSLLAQKAGICCWPFFIRRRPMNKDSPTPSRRAGLQRLQDFLPGAGTRYARSRNFDLGPGRHANVSMLSPYLRHRLVVESEVLQTVLQHHSAGAAEKFIQEVFWRAYFKGWLERRPSVWTDYRQSVDVLLRSLDEDPDLARRYAEAIDGNTGIDCFDAWAQELVSRGYLHNHTRMWFASIWAFTLGLPWQLGADFFLRHLIDGDPASNTLSWRWVCGLHTRGKTYLARASNIARFTHDRFSPQGQLATNAPALTEAQEHPLLPLRATDALGPVERCGLLVTEEDCFPESVIGDRAPVAALGIVATRLRSPLPVGRHAVRFAELAVGDAVARVADHFTIDAAMSTADDCSEALTEWASRHGLESVVTAYAPVGPVASILDEARGKLAQRGIRLLQLRRRYDDLTWPHASRGFFQLRKQIPSLLEALAVAEPTRRHS